MARASTSSDVFNAVAEATRRQLIDLLADGDATVTELVGRAGLAQPQVSKHLQVLARVGLVEAHAEGRHRRYRLRPAALVPLQQWLAPYERMINARHDRLDALLHELQGGTPEPGTNTDIASTTEEETPS
jgi:DNA-binding transcriptional ArsR family regulator